MTPQQERAAKRAIEEPFLATFGGLEPRQHPAGKGRMSMLADTSPGSARLLYST